MLDNLSSDAEGLTYAGKMMSDTLDDLVAHLADPLPHIYPDGDGNHYCYGLAVIDGIPNLVREKIEEPEP